MLLIFRIGFCAGKQTIANYLVENHAFIELRLARTAINSCPKKHAFEIQRLNQPSQESKSVSNDFYFYSVEALLDFVTKRWDQRWVIKEIQDDQLLEVLSRRPFFLFISVDAPLNLRWQRTRARSTIRILFLLFCYAFKTYVFYRCQSYHQSPPNLEEFVMLDDDHLYNQSFGLARLVNKAEVRFVNSTSSLSELHSALEKMDLTNEQRLRPSWDQYFMQLASLAAQRSNCMKRRVGCVLVREKRVISTGYNGTPRNLRNCNERGCKSSYSRSSEMNTFNCIRFKMQ